MGNPPTHMDMDMDPGTHKVQAAKALLKKTFATLRGIHQREGVVWMCRREARPGAVAAVAGGILADEMGMGKTFQVAALMSLRPMRTLIVTTLSTIMQWQDVISSRLGSPPFVLRGKDQAEGRGFAGAWTVLTTYSMFQHLDKVPLALGQGWGRIVLDEAHIIRNPKGNTHRALSRLCARHRWVLTGTPVNNSVKDLHTLVTWLGAPGLNVDMIRTHLLLRRTKSTEALRCPLFSIPSLTIVDCVVSMCDAERHAYNLIEASGRAHAAGDGGGMEGALAMDGGACFHIRVMEAVLRCRQACTHVSIMSEAVSRAMVASKEERSKLHEAMRDPLVRSEACRYPVDATASAKISRLVEMVTDHSKTEKGLVFCDWLAEMEIIEKALQEGAGVQVVLYHGAMDLGQRQSALRSFESLEEGAVMIAQIQCGGTGLNIQSASRVYLMRPAWNPCIEQQAISRAHRCGQTRPVIVTRLIAADSIDVRCVDIQRRKLAIISSVYDTPDVSAATGLTTGKTSDSVQLRAAEAMALLRPA